MNIRKEKSGLHYFDRLTGLHILLDEIDIPQPFRSVVPRSVSIALTNDCDMQCPYCYVSKSKTSVPFEFLCEFAKRLDELGCLEVTLGGGEPLLHPNFPDICNWIWDSTNLAIGVTTNGLHLSPQIISSIIGKISSIRFSIDGIDPYYTSIKGKPLINLLDIISSIRGRIPFGINTIARPNLLFELNDVIRLSVKIGAQDVLIIPEHKNGKFILNKSEWEELNDIINSNKSINQLLLTYDAYEFININCLETASSEEFLFAHMSADRELKTNSYSKEGILIADINRLEEYFSQLYKLKGGN